MKKKTLIITLIILFNIMLLPLNAYAESCSYSEVNEYQKELEKLSINIEYNSSYFDWNGDTHESYFNVWTSNLPDGFTAYVGTTGGYYESAKISNDSKAAFTGGIYIVKIYSSNCDDPVKTYEIRIPYYMSYCELEGLCTSEYATYDGTEETKKAEETTAETEENIDTRLIIVLIALIVILVLCIIILLKRRASKKVEL